MAPNRLIHLSYRKKPKKAARILASGGRNIDVIVVTHAPPSR